MILLLLPHKFRAYSGCHHAQFSRPAWNSEILVLPPSHTLRGETSLTPLPGYEWCVFRWARPSPLCILRSFLRPHCLWTTVISLLITLLLRLCIRMSHHYSGQWSSEAVAISEVDSLGHFLGHSINFLLVWTRGHAWMVHHSLQVNWCVLKQCMVQSRCLVTG